MELVASTTRYDTKDFPEHLTSRLMRAQNRVSFRCIGYNVPRTNKFCNYCDGFYKSTSRDRGNEERKIYNI